MSLSFYQSVFLPVIAHPNDIKKKKRESYISSTTYPPKYPLPSSSAFSSGLFWGLNPNDCPNPYPATAAPPEGRIVKSPKYVLSDMGCAVEAFPERVGSQFGPGGGEKLRPAPLRRSDMDLEFPLPVGASLPYEWPVFLSHILMINLAWDSMGPGTTSFLIFYRSVMS